MASNSDLLRVAEADDFSTADALMKEISDKGWARTTQWQAAPLSVVKYPGMWGIRYYERERSSTTKSHRKWVSVALAKYATKELAEANIVGFWTTAESYKGSEARRAALSLAAISPPESAEDEVMEALPPAPGPVPLGTQPVFPKRRGEDAKAASRSKKFKLADISRQVVNVARVARAFVENIINSKRQGAARKRKVFGYRRGKMDKTPKCHPEIAGEGVELCWGKSAYEFRHNTNSGVVKDLRMNAMKALRPEILTLARLRRFERMVWRYKQVYRHFAKGEASAVEHAEIERLQRTYKNHRGCDYELKLVEGKVHSSESLLG